MSAAITMRRPVGRHRVAFAAAVATLAAVAAPAARAGVTYSYNDWANLEYPAYTTLDDGTGPVASDIWLGNLFDAAPGGQWITHLAANFDSTMPAGTPVSVLLYDDPNDDGNPDDLVLVRRLDSTVRSTPAGYYAAATGFDIPPTYVSGTFMAAVLIPDQPASATFRVDATAPHNRSYYAANVAPHVGTFDPAHPGAADQPVQWVGPYDLFVRAYGRATQYARAQEPLTIDSFSEGAVSLDHDGAQQTGLSSVPGGARTLSIYGSAAVDTAGAGLLTVSGGPDSVGYGYQYNGNFGSQAGSDTAFNANASGYDALRINIASQSPGSRLEIHVTLATDGQTSSLASYSPAIYTAYGQTGAFDIPLSSIPGSVDYTDLDHLFFTFYNYGGTAAIDSIQFVALPLPGDVNGDDRITADDYALIDRGYQQHLTGHVNGDLNADGTVDAADYLQLDTAFALAGNALSPQFLSDRRSQFGDAYVTTLLASVPEPTSLFAACGLALPLARRRPRRNAVR